MHRKINMAGYDPNKAVQFNKLRQQGLSEDAALAQSGLTDADLGNYAIGTNGQMGALIIGTEPRPGIEVVNTVNYDETAAAPVSSTTPTTYTTTSTETVSGGGSRTITVTPRQPTEASQALNPQIAEAQARISEFNAANPSDFTRKLQGLPPLTPEEKQTRQDQLDALTLQKADLQRQQASLETPSAPVVTTVPNTTTTTQTVTTVTAPVNNAVQTPDGPDPTVNQQNDITNGTLNNATPTATTVSGADPANVPANQANQTQTQQATTVDPALANLPTGLAAPLGANGLPIQEVPFVPDDDPANVPTNQANQTPTQQATVVDPALANLPTGLAAPLGANGLPMQEVPFVPEVDPLAEQLALQQQEQAVIEEQALNARLDAAVALDEQQDEGIQTAINAQNAQDLVDAYSPQPQPDPYSTTPLDQQTQDLTNAATAGAKSVNAGTNRAQNASTLQTRLNQPSAADWRVRLQLAPGATYLYKAQDAVILKPLAETDGVIFPYTPTISTSYNAKYDPYDLVHSNYRGYFYKSSHVETISIKGTFTAQDSREAAYLLAVIHFFRSVTKMFYGQDQEAGTPPPLVFLSGLGKYQFNNHSCVVSQFSYNLPNDVDYIRADGFNNIGLNMENRRNQSSGPAPGGSLGTVMSVINRLTNSGLKNGSLTNVPSPGQVNQNVTNQSAINSTYVPTKMEIDISLYPMQTRDQVSKLFSLKGYANGSLLQGGFW